MSIDIEHWLLANHQKNVYVLRESQNLKGLIPISLTPNYDTESLLPALDASRVIKDHDEIDLIRRAIKISSLAHRTVMHHITSMKFEAEVHVRTFWSYSPPSGLWLESRDIIFGESGHSFVPHGISFYFSITLKRQC